MQTYPSEDDLLKLFDPIFSDETSFMMELEVGQAALLLMMLHWYLTEGDPAFQQVQEAAILIEGFAYPVKAYHANVTKILDMFVRVAKRRAARAGR